MLVSNSEIADSTPILIELSMPYNEDAFGLNVEVGAMNLNTLNPTLKPLAGVEIETGHMQRDTFYYGCRKLCYTK